MADRAIIPGASQEFLGFLGGAFDAPQVVKDNPDAGLVRLLLLDMLDEMMCFRSFASSYLCVLFVAWSIAHPNCTYISYYTPC